MGGAPRKHAFFSTGWKLSGVSAQVAVNKLHLESGLFHNGFGLDLECTNIEGSFVPGDVDLPLPPSVQFHILAQGGKLNLVPEWDSLTWVENILRPYFVGQSLDTTFHLRTNCPGQVGDLAEKLIRTRLRDLPSKDADFYHRTTLDLARNIDTATVDALKDALPNIPSGIDFADSLLMTVQPDASLKIIPVGQAAQDFLSPAARALVRRLRSDEGPVAQAIFSPNSLSRIAALGMSAAAVANGGNYQNDRLEFVLPADFKAQQFAPFVTELVNVDGALPVQLRLAIPFTDNGALNPAFRPWISATGVDAGIDLEATVHLEFIRKDDQSVLADRQLSVRLVFTDIKNAAGVTSWSYTKGEWPAASRNGAPPELGLTLDWILNSELFRDFLQKELQAALEWKEMGRFSFRRVGQATMGYRRADGGYYAEALIIEVALPDKLLP
ncbi:MAG: efflux RND transporter permease subunit [Bdellovibrionales bacterium]|nr:efflux RND transporter permease subunit [Bdellovibrionales bacterium]